MKQFHFILIVIAAICSLAGCAGEEYYSTPEKTLQRYVANRLMANRIENEACINTLSKKDQEWWKQHHGRLCGILYGQQCPEGVTGEITVWTDKFEPAGPKTATVESSSIDEKAGTATLVVNGKEIPFVKEGGNWKIKGLFGVPETLVAAYPQLSE